MKAEPAGGLLTLLSQVPDPRGLQGRRHPLAALLAAIVCAVLSNARGCDAIAEWVRAKGLGVWHALGGRRRPPCSNTFRDLLAVLPPEEFESRLHAWIQSLPVAEQPSSTAETLPAIPLDGKTLRGTMRAHQSALHLLTAWDARQGGVLKQMVVPHVGQEAELAVHLIRQLVLSGRVVSGDAAFCHVSVCQAVLDQQGDYLLAVKDNQPTLKQALVSEFTAANAAFSPLRTTGAGSGARDV